MQRRLLVVHLHLLADHQLLNMAFLNSYYFIGDIYNSLMDVDKSFAYFLGGRFTGIRIRTSSSFRDKDFLIALKHGFHRFVSVPVFVIALLIAVAEQH